MKLVHLRRAAAVALAGALLALAALVPAAAAGNTRIVYIGSTFSGSSCADAAANPARVGALSVTPYSLGGRFKVDIRVVNCGGQNLSHLRLTVGRHPGALNVLSAPFTAADGLVFAEQLSAQPTGLQCGGLGTGLYSCQLKSLRPGASNGIVLSLVVSSTQASAATSLHAAATVNEKTNDRGSNEDTFEATTALHPQPFSCDAVATFLTGGSNTARTCDIGTGNSQSSSVTYQSRPLPITLSETATSNAGINAASCAAGAGKTPVGQDVNADIDGEQAGESVSWTIRIDLKAIGKGWLNTKKLVICHWDDAGSYSAPLCNVKITKTAQGILTVTFTTSGNGKTRLLA